MPANYDMVQNSNIEELPNLYDLSGNVNIRHLLPLPLDAAAKLLLLTAGTFGVSLLLYEGIRRVKWVRPLFGMKIPYR